MIDECFTGGLLHDIGKMVLLKNRAREYSEVIATIYRDGGVFDDVESRIFGFTHPDVGAYLAREWRFPRQLVEAIQHHHNFQTAPSFPQAAAIIHLADRIMAKLGVGFIKDSNLNLGGDEAVRFLDITPPALQDLIKQVEMMIKAAPGMDEN
jgi:putative nucleotidyltransferase with HDIG domain